MKPYSNNDKINKTFNRFKREYPHLSDLALHVILWYETTGITEFTQEEVLEIRYKENSFLASHNIHNGIKYPIDDLNISDSDLNKKLCADKSLISFLQYNPEQYRLLVLNDYKSNQRYKEKYVRLNSDGTFSIKDSI